jgi:hypothetical protein
VTHRLRCALLLAAALLIDCSCTSLPPEVAAELKAAATSEADHFHPAHPADASPAQNTAPR